MGPTERKRTAGRTAAVAAAVGLLCTVTGLGQASAAPKQAAVPTVSITAQYGEVQIDTDCKGNRRETVDAPIRFTVHRTGDTTAPLDVILAFSGDLAASSGLSSPATIPAGAADVVLQANDATRGSLSAAIQPDAAYAIAPPGVDGAGVSPLFVDRGCGIGNARSEQTTFLGQQPLAVDVVGIAYGPPPGLDRSIVGQVPPGTTFHLDGTWSGQTTELGTFRFFEYFCESDDWCPYRASITVNVVPFTGESVPATVPPTPRSAPPAQPVPTDPNYTG